MSTTAQGPSRRTLVKGAAWSVPVVAMAQPAMAVVCSPNSCPPECLQAGYANGSCKCPGSGNDWGYQLGICFTNTCTGSGGEGVIIDVTLITNNAGKVLVGTYPTIVVPPTGEPACSEIFFYTSESSASKIRVYYSIDGVDQGFKEFDAPPDCAPGVCPDDQLTGTSVEKTDVKVDEAPASADVATTESAPAPAPAAPAPAAPVEPAPALAPGDGASDTDTP